MLIEVAKGACRGLELVLNKAGLRRLSQMSQRAMVNARKGPAAVSARLAESHG